MTIRIHRVLKVVVLNANDTGRQRYERNNQLQEQHIDMSLLSENCNAGSLQSVQSRCERWKTRTNEDKTQAIYFYHRRRPVVVYFTLKERNIFFVNHVKYIGEIFDTKIVWRLTHRQ
jgi:hypothetical protein